MLVAGSEIGSGVDVHRVHIIGLAARFRVATRSSTLGGGLDSTSTQQHARHPSCIFFSVGGNSVASLHGVCNDEGPCP